MVQRQRRSTRSPRPRRRRHSVAAWERQHGALTTDELADGLAWALHAGFLALCTTEPLTDEQAKVGPEDLVAGYHSGAVRAASRAAVRTRAGSVGCRRYAATRSRSAANVSSAAMTAWAPRRRSTERFVPRVLASWSRHSICARDGATKGAAQNDTRRRVRDQPRTPSTRVRYEPAVAAGSCTDEPENPGQDLCRNR